MLPTVWPGDTLVVEGVSSKDVFEGDVVMFSNGHRLVAHRIVAKNGGCQHPMVQTQGDAVPHPDSPVSERDVFGKVSFILRNGKCVEPRRRLGFSERVLAAVFRCSPFVARVVVVLHGLHQTSIAPSQDRMSQAQASQLQIS